MKKRKISSLGCSQDVKTEENIKSNIVSNKNEPNCKIKKGLHILGDINHKNNSGANNWQTFLKLNQNLAKPRLMVKKTNRPYQLNEHPSVNPICLPKEASSKSKNRNFNDSKFNDEPVQNDNEVKPISKVKFGEGQTNSSKHKPVLTKQIAMDCEMVGVEVGVNKNMLARISLVNAHGDCIYDKYVKPTEPVLDYRTWVSGIRAKDLENASEFKTVQQEVANIIKGRILVGHALQNDLKVLFLSHPRHAIRDTSKFKKLGPVFALKKLAKKYLGVTIQDGEHSSVQDALATMQLYKMFKKDWEASFRTKNIKTKKQKHRFGP